MASVTIKPSAFAATDRKIHGCKKRRSGSRPQAADAGDAADQV
jgi:hypothetical protein